MGFENRDVAHWDCWGWSGMKTVSRPEPNSTPERAMELLLEKARLVFGEQDWSAWAWTATEYGTRSPRLTTSNQAS
jgi:hypothetical protein